MDQRLLECVVKFLIANQADLIFIASLLQIIGTLSLSLFSFYGIKITKSKNTYVNGKPITHVEFVDNWITIAKIGLIIVVIGTIISGLVGIAQTRL